MDPNILAPFQRVQIDIRSNRSHPGPVVFTFAASPDTPSLGAAGNEAGDILFIQEDRPDQDTRFRGIVALGAREKITPESARRAGAAVSRWMLKNQQQDAMIDPAGLLNLQLPGVMPALLEGLHLGAFRFERHKTEETWDKNLSFSVLADEKDSELVHQIQITQVISAAVNLAREWGHEPANVINPVTLAERVRVIAGQAGLTCTIFDEQQLEEMKAGAILSVGMGSQTPPRLIVLENAAVKTSDHQPVVLVGKALTFDSGGYSLKDATNIQGMKYDKLGGIYVFAIMVAAAVLKLDVPLVGIIGAAENMISANAYRPDDIVTTLAGKTVEIVTTDAEGRLVLADALTFAQTHYQPRAMLDLATLTGGVVVALGRVRAGFMANDDMLAGALHTSGERTYERLWRLPLDDDYAKLIKGDDADLKNSGGREGHPVFGGVFLKQFVDAGIPWAHLDIAGVADTPKELPYSPKGATGFGIRLVLDYLMNLD